MTSWESLASGIDVDGTLTHTIFLNIVADQSHLHVATFLLSVGWRSFCLQAHDHRPQDVNLYLFFCPCASDTVMRNAGQLLTGFWIRLQSDPWWALCVAQAWGAWLTCWRIRRFLITAIFPTSHKAQVRCCTGSFIYYKNMVNSVLLHFHYM